MIAVKLTVTLLRMRQLSTWIPEVPALEFLTSHEVLHRLTSVCCRVKVWESLGAVCFSEPPKSKVIVEDSL